jgi:hypothetical protein
MQMAPVVPAELMVQGDHKARHNLRVRVVAFPVSALAAPEVETHSYMAGEVALSVALAVLVAVVQT